MFPLHRNCLICFNAAPPNSFAVQSALRSHPPPFPAFQFAIKETPAAYLSQYENLPVFLYIFIPSRWRFMDHKTPTEGWALLEHKYSPQLRYKSKVKKANTTCHINRHEICVLFISKGFRINKAIEGKGRKEPFFPFSIPLRCWKLLSRIYFEKLILTWNIEIKSTMIKNFLQHISCLRHMFLKIY